MTAVIAWPVRCTQPACDHTARIADDVLDRFHVGATAICGCHKGNDAALLGIEAFKCGAA